MKTYFNLRSTIGNSSWPQRGLAVLAALVVVAVVSITLIQALRPGLGVAPAAPAAPAANPAQSNNSAPLIGAGSAYDGSTYVEYLLAAPAAQNPNVPISGTGSAYDGGAYGAARRPSALPRVPYEAGWQLYDNGWAGGPRTTPQSQIGSGIGSVYDGGAHGTARPAAQAQSTGLGIDLPADTDFRGMPPGLTDYLRRAQVTDLAVWPSNAITLPPTPGIRNCSTRSKVLVTRRFVVSDCISSASASHPGSRARSTT